MIEELGDEIRRLSDDSLLDRAAGYNARLRRGRKMVEEGQAIIDSNIEPFVICQNVMHARMSDRLSRATDLKE